MRIGNLVNIQMVLMLNKQTNGFPLKLPCAEAVTHSVFDGQVIQDTLTGRTLLVIQVILARSWNSRTLGVSVKGCIIYGILL